MKFTSSHHCLQAAGDGRGPELRARHVRAAARRGGGARQRVRGRHAGQDPGHGEAAARDRDLAVARPLLVDTSL